MVIIHGATTTTAATVKTTNITIIQVKFVLLKIRNGITDDITLKIVKLKKDFAHFFDGFGDNTKDVLHTKELIKPYLIKSFGFISVQHVMFFAQ